MMIRAAMTSLWLIVFVLATAVARCDEPKPEKQTKAVTVIIDYGDGVQKHFTSIPWKDGLTVLNALRVAQSHPRGIRFEHTGEGATALLTKIDDLKNEGRGRNWVYRINGQLADTGFGVRKLAEGDSVLWKFEPYR